MLVHFVAGESLMKAFRTYRLDGALRRQRERLETERKQLLQVVHETLLAIRHKYSITEAYIVGSLITPHNWTDNSDVDVAIAGCSQHVLDVMKDLELATGRDVDVIDLDNYPTPESIKRKGVKVYET